MDRVGGTDFAVLPGGDLLVVSTTEGSAVLQWWSSGGEPGASALYAHPGAGTAARRSSTATRGRRSGRRVTRRG